ncbi:MAG: electron transfer flavoprotein subunit beta/FixA family protein [Candidatus Eisenbacteria bacterium]
MNLLVCVKHVPDTESSIRIKPDGSGLETEGLNFVLNPYDEYAVEEAVRLKEKIGEGKITIVCVGPQNATKSIRTALAMGADDAVHVVYDGYQRYDGVATAAILAGVIRGMEFDLILCGKQAVDDDCAQTGPALAEFLGLPNVSVITRLELAEDGKKITVHRELEGAEEVIECVLPAVVTAQKGLNEPRYPSLPNIMKAKKKPVVTRSLDELELDEDARTSSIEIRGFAPPPARKTGQVLEGTPQDIVKELIRLLRDEAKLI